MPEQNNNNQQQQQIPLITITVAEYRDLTQCIVRLEQERLQYLGALQQNAMQQMQQRQQSCDEKEVTNES